MGSYDWYGQVKTFRLMYAERATLTALEVHAVVLVDGAGRWLLHVGDAA